MSSQADKDALRSLDSYEELMNVIERIVVEDEIPFPVVMAALKEDMDEGR